MASAKARDLLVQIDSTLRQSLALCEEQERTLAGWDAEWQLHQGQAGRLDDTIRQVHGQLDGWQERLRGLGSVVAATEAELARQEEEMRAWTEQFRALRQSRN